MNQPITLCMIVKDEAHVIERCLAAVKPYITGFVICDTGSTDNTKEVIEQAVGDLPGEVHDSEWVNFGHNRNVALQLARAFANNEGYILVIDADDTFVAKEGFEWPAVMEADAYSLLHRSQDVWWRTQMYKASEPWKYTGPVHEWAELEGRAGLIKRVHNCEVQIGQDGARRGNLGAREKYLADAKLLLAEVEKNPSDTRCTFYLAQSYRDAGEREKAITYYRKRIELGGYEEERWYSAYQIGLIYKSTGEDDDEARRFLVRAFKMRPHRMEPAIALASLYRKREEWPLAALWSSYAVHSRSWGQDLLFIDQASHGGWRALDEYSLALYYMGRRDEALNLIKTLLRMDPPASELPRLEDNLVRSGGSLYEPYPINTDAERDVLQPLRAEYCEKVSNDAWALSLEAGATLKALVDKEDVTTVLDLGSGFSSAVFRTCPLERIVSVETGAEWREKTLAFLGSMDESDAEHDVVLFDDVELEDDEVFDLVVLDMAETTTRAMYLPLAWAHVRDGGMLYVDDMHHWPYNQQVKDFVAEIGGHCLDVVNVTRDHFGRFGLLVKKP